MAEQRYQAVLAVISDGLSISQVASKLGVGADPPRGQSVGQGDIAQNIKPCRKLRSRKPFRTCAADSPGPGTQAESTITFITSIENLGDG